MNYRPLGTTDVKVSEISFGCWTMGGLNFVNGSMLESIISTTPTFTATAGPSGCWRACSIGWA